MEDKLNVAVCGIPEKRVSVEKSELSCIFTMRKLSISLSISISISCLSQLAALLVYLQLRGHM